MFQYTHEVIFNSLTMADGSQRLVRDGGNKGPLTIKRGGEYWKAFIQDQKIYKTAGNVGAYEILKFDVAKLAALFPGTNGAVMNPGTYQLSMFVKLLDPHALYEFAYPNYKSFGRQILIGFDVAASDTVADIASVIFKSLNEAVRKEEFAVDGLDPNDGDPIMKSFEDGVDTVIAIRAKHYALRFDSLGIAAYDETTCDSCIGEYLPTISIFDRGDSTKPAVVAVEGVEPFATGEWLLENFRFPTYPNIRWEAVGVEDRPVPGVVYVQYSFAYDSPRPQFGGASGVGQKVEAVTRHIYYVPVALASAFESAFTNLGVTVVNTMPAVTDPDGNAVAGGEEQNPNANPENPGVTPVQE